MPATRDAAVPPPSTAVRALAATVAVEGIAAAVPGALILVDLLMGKGRASAVAQITLVAMFLAAGVALLVVARGVLARKRRSRAPALLTQLLAIPVGWALLANSAILGGAVILAGATAFLLLLLPSGGGQLEG